MMLSRGGQCSRGMAHLNDMHYRDKPNTVVIQYIVLFSHLTVLLPSDALSQKQEAAVCRPAPAL